MNVVVLTAEFPSSPWRRAFADAMIRLRPDLNPDAVDELSDSAYLRLADLDPVSAAARYSRGGHLPADSASDGVRQHSVP